MAVSWGAGVWGSIPVLHMHVHAPLCCTRMPPCAAHACPVCCVLLCATTALRQFHRATRVVPNSLMVYYIYIGMLMLMMR